MPFYFLPCSIAKLEAFCSSKNQVWKPADLGLQPTSPPEMMISLLRSKIEMLPSSCMTARSPELKYPPRNAAFVASGSRKYCGCPSSAKQGLKIIRLLYLFQCDVPSGHNLSDGFAVGGNVGEDIASVLINHTNFLRGGECMTLASHVFGAFLECEPLPEWLRIASCKGSICLHKLPTRDEFTHCIPR